VVFEEGVVGLGEGSVLINEEDEGFVDEMAGACGCVAVVVIVVCEVIVGRHGEEYC
jgi:hypothetical protein